MTKTRSSSRAARKVDEERPLKRIKRQEEEEEDDDDEEEEDSEGSEHEAIASIILTLRKPGEDDSIFQKKKPSARKPSMKKKPKRKEVILEKKKPKARKTNLKSISPPMKKKSSKTSITLKPAKVMKNKIKPVEWLWPAKLPPPINGPSLDLSEASVWALLQKQHQEPRIALRSFPGSALSSTELPDQNQISQGLVVKTEPAIISVVNESSEDTLKNNHLFSSNSSAEDMPRTDPLQSPINEHSADTEPMCEYLGTSNTQRSVDPA